jgi:hypothetical protein
LFWFKKKKLIDHSQFTLIMTRIFSQVKFNNFSFENTYHILKLSSIIKINKNNGLLKKRFEVLEIKKKKLNLV